jgi:DNA gyrase subunit A
MSFREGDELLSMNVVRAGTFVFTATDGGYAKRTAVDEYRVQGRGGLGIKAARLSDERGQLVAGLVVNDTDEVLAVRESGQVTRSAVAGVLPKGRDTMGLTFAKADGDPVVAIARNAERDVPDDEVEETASEPSSTGSEETTAQES